MIASLTGGITAISLDSLIINVHGVGYRVHITGGTSAQVRHGQEVTLFTELVVREDSQTLYGFLSQTEVDFFRTIMAANGVGPKTALAALSVLSPVEFAKAVLASDMKTITKVPGIGLKGAQRLALDLKEKMPAFATETTETGSIVAVAVEAALAEGALNADALEVVGGLQGLGWNEKAALEAVESVLKSLQEAGEPQPAQATLLRLALRELGGR